MQLSFQKESDFSSSRVSQLEKSLNGDKTTVMLHHSEHCGHCHQMRGEFENFKNSTKSNVMEVEGSALGKLQEHKSLYKKVTPADGSMYFPMILIFIHKKKHLYEGERTKEGINKFISTHTKPKSASKPKTATKPKTASVKSKIASKPKSAKPKTK